MERKVGYEDIQKVRFRRLCEWLDSVIGVRKKHQHVLGIFRNVILWPHSRPSESETLDKGLNN